MNKVPAVGLLCCVFAECFGGGRISDDAACLRFHSLFITLPTLWGEDQHHVQPLENLEGKESFSEFVFVYLTEFRRFNEVRGRCGKSDEQTKLAGVEIWIELGTSVAGEDSAVHIFWDIPALKAIYYRIIHSFGWKGLSKLAKNSMVKSYYK